MEHYILKGVTDALFLDFRNYHNRITVKNIEEVTPRGVVYTLRSVLRGSRILNAHFTGVYILQRGCFSVCSFAIGCGRPEEWDRQMQAPTFFLL